VLAATARAEILVGPARAGGNVLTATETSHTAEGTVPVSATVADDAAALKV
jgi:hypothetical protein